MCLWWIVICILKLPMITPSSSFHLIPPALWSNIFCCVHFFLNCGLKNVSQLSCWHASSVEQTAGKLCKLSELLQHSHISLSRLFKWPHRCSLLMCCRKTSAIAPPNRKHKVKAYLELTFKILFNPLLCQRITVNELFVHSIRAEVSAMLLLGTMPVLYLFILFFLVRMCHQ